MSILRRRRSLLRAAAVGGAAYSAGKRKAESEQPPEEPPTPSQRDRLSADEVEHLKSLSQLHDQGILTDQEFDHQKSKLLGT